MCIYTYIYPDAGANAERWTKTRNAAIPINALHGGDTVYADLLREPPCCLAMRNSLIWHFECCVCLLKLCFIYTDFAVLDTSDLRYHVLELYNILQQTCTLSEEWCLLGCYAVWLL
jgi:hypothetical protein